jgi:hypothetical protein
MNKWMLATLCIAGGILLLAAGVKGTSPATAPTTATTLSAATTYTAEIDVRDKVMPARDGEDVHEYPLPVEERGIYELTFSSLAKGKPLQGTLNIVNELDAPLYKYAIADPSLDYLFFPVLEPRAYVVRFTVGSDGSQGIPFHITARQYHPEVTAAMQRSAEAAIDRSIALLMKYQPEENTGDDARACEALAMMALGTGKGAAERMAIIDQVYLPRIAEQFSESPDNIWQGHRVKGWFSNDHFGYAHAIATLALAEVAEARGSDKARALAVQGVECLLATQNTERKSPLWEGPVKRSSVYYGGWRYRPQDITSDISVTGWCAVALGAAGAAHIEVDGMRDGVDDAVAYVKSLGSAHGFSYVGGDDTADDVRLGVGVLISLLFGEDAGILNGLTQNLDTHLPAGTQVDRGFGFPLYYAYYGTRANYLRGGYAWEAWRATMIRQLLKLQKPDGSWSSFDDEQGLGPIYSSAMGTMILRMCLNDVPAYLRQEVRGF